MTTNCLADRTAPGELLRLVADGLAGAGLDVRPPCDADGCRLDIAWPGARCTLAVGDCGSAEWEYWPWSLQDADPDLTADLASIAGSVVEAVTRAMSLLRSAEAGRAGHG